MKRSVSLDVLSHFRAHGLTFPQQASLLSRVDTKFVFPRAELPGLLEKLAERYSVLEIDGRRISDYRNTYLDTYDHVLYRTHHQGRLNRFKVRYRQYIDTRSAFLEIKFRNNKGRTGKHRCPSPHGRFESARTRQFLHANLQALARQLIPSQHNGFERIALASDVLGERITIDQDIRFSSADRRPCMTLPEVCVAELKQSRRNLNSPFARLMSQAGYRPTSFSKYCIGCALLSPTLKKNRFKPQLMKLLALH